MRHPEQCYQEETIIHNARLIFSLPKKGRKSHIGLHMGGGIEQFWSAVMEEFQVTVNNSIYSVNRVVIES